MDKKLITLTLVIILLVISLFSACSTSTSSSTSTSTSTSSTTKSVTSTTTSTQSITTQSVTSTQVSTTTPTTTQVNWWDKFGEPEYGGTITIGAAQINNAFDPYNWGNGQNSLWYEAMWFPDWTLDRSTRVFAHMWIPNEYWEKYLAESWEWEDAQTLVVHLRQDVYWQDKEPVNGRQFTADDVVWHFDRMLGTGNGFDTPNPFLAGRFASCKNVTAKDKYTVVFHFKQPTIFTNSLSIIPEPILQFFEAPEVFAMGEPVAAAEGGTSGLNSALNDWTNQVGTGPFMLTDFVSGSSMTQSKNPNYWGYDERHPQNQLPYIDTIKTIYISDTSTSLAALRTGKIDRMESINWQQAESLVKTNPVLLKETYAAPGYLIQLRCDRTPFTDIKVRIALQMAIDLPTISKSLYGGLVEGIPVGVVNSDYKGYALPYEEWTQELKDEYTYNPTKAKQLLGEAGYPNGFSTHILAGSGSDLSIYEVMKSYFADIGVDMEIRTMDTASLRTYTQSKKHEQMVASGTSDDMPPQMGMRMYITSEPDNSLCNNDAVYDAMVDSVLNASSEDEAKRLITETNTYFLQQHWVVMTFPLVSYGFWQPYLKGFSGEKSGPCGFAGYYARYWIDQDLKASMER